MFDISWGEFIIVGVVALIVIGPKELPGVIRAVGRSLAKLRTMAGEFRSQFDDALREAELHDVKKEFDEFKNQATGLSTSTFDPIRKELQSVAESAKATASGETGVTTVNETVQGISAEAQAMEAEIRAGASDATAPAAEPAPAAVEPARSGNAA
jgi:sec-independent protein translocase protein TatB